MMLSEHGKMVAEMQQRYATQRIHAEKLEKQVTELICRLQEKDNIIQENENRLKELTKMEFQIQKLKQKADITPTAQLLKEELINTTKRYEEELNCVQARFKINSDLLKKKDLKIVEFEDRIKDLIEKNASIEHKKTNLELELDKVNKKLQKSYNLVVKDFDVNNLTEKELIDEIKKRCVVLKEKNSNFNFATTFSEFVFDQFKPKDEAKNTLNSLKINEVVKNECVECVLNQNKLEELNFQITDLQRQLKNFEILHETENLEHKKVCESLRKQIIDLEINRNQAYSQFSSEYKQKVLEMEEALKHQQTRICEIIDEKNKEIEYTRNNNEFLNSKNASICTKQNYAIDPLDPAPRYSDNFEEQKNDFLKLDFQKILNNQSTESNSNQKLTIEEARNLFYEQTITKNEEENIKLRKIARLSELKVCEIEQALLTKDVQYIQIIEILKEEIRKLEGKLSIKKSETNLAYLRNIFVQFINSVDSQTRRHILKAIGAVLKLTQTEMKKIDFCNV